MKTVNHYYETVIRSGCVKNDLFAFETEEEAIRFAEDSRWSWFDENGFEWDIEIEERNEDCCFFTDEDFDDLYSEAELDAISESLKHDSHEVHCHIDCKDDWQRDMLLGILERLDNISDIYVQYEGNARIYFTSTDGKISEAIFSSVWIDD